MRISTKGRYALRLMVDLAVHYGDGYTTIKTISERQKISDKYLEQIITILSKNDFVIGVRGPSGGYKLSQSPDEYTVGMILRAVEANLSPVFCVDDEDNQCDNKENCVTYEVWEKIKNAVDNVVDSITLEDLAAKMKKKNIDKGLMN